MSFNPNSLKDLAEDVHFEKVNEPSMKPQIDKNARAEQIIKDAKEYASEFKKKDPVAAILFIIMFSSGAKWADAHPESDFSNRAERESAMRSEVISMLKEASGTNDRDFMLDTMCYAIFTTGVQWADENPAPTL